MDHPKVSQNCQAALDGITKDQKNGVPGVVFAAIDKHGEIITQNASGHRGINRKQPMDADTIFWIASCTKLICTIACLQLVEQDKLKLDDAQHLYKYCPELEKKQVIQDDLSLAPRTKDITLRMLLNHTAGFGYEFFSPKMRDFYRPVGFDVFGGNPRDFLDAHLVNQPGERFEYGINIDWAGIYLERVTGTSLGEYMTEHIFTPLKLHNISFFPNSSMKSNLATLHQRWPGQTELHERDHAVIRALTPTNDAERAAVFNSGGGGLFAQPSEYIHILACLLNGGAHPKSGVRILSPASVDAMFENQLPNDPDFARQGTLAAKPEYTHPLAEFYPQENNPPQGWGLSWHLLIEPGPTGRGKNSAWWAGIANLFYWVDRDKGVAGMIASQVLPFGDLQVLGAWGACEAAIYQGMEEGSKGSKM